jgi:hypothetical protein
MNKTIKNDLALFFYMLISTIFFVVSFKYSGAEAYHKSGLTSYLKWSILSLILNTGFFIQSFKPTGWIKALTIPLMLIAILVNWLIYTNPKDLVIYDILSVVLILMSLYLFVKGLFRNGKNLYA